MKLIKILATGKTFIYYILKRKSLVSIYFCPANWQYNIHHCWTSYISGVILSCYAFNDFINNSIIVYPYRPKCARCTCSGMPHSHSLITWGAVPVCPSIKGISRWDCWKEVHVLMTSHAVLVAMNGQFIVCNNVYYWQAALMIRHGQGDRA